MTLKYPLELNKEQLRNKFQIIYITFPVVGEVSKYP